MTHKHLPSKILLTFIFTHDPKTIAIRLQKFNNSLKNNNTSPQCTESLILPNTANAKDGSWEHADIWSQAKAIQCSNDSFFHSMSYLRSKESHYPCNNELIPLSNSDVIITERLAVLYCERFPNKSSHMHQNIVLIQWNPCALLMLSLKGSFSGDLDPVWNCRRWINGELVRSRVTNY